MKKESEVIAFRNSEFSSGKLNSVESNSEFNFINSITDIFTLNGDEIKSDINNIFSKQDLEWQGDLNKLEKIKRSNIKIGKNSIYIEEGAVVKHCILNTTNGPIYIGKNAEIMEGSMIRGPFAMCENSVVKMGNENLWRYHNWTIL